MLGVFVGDLSGGGQAVTMDEMVHKWQQSTLSLLLICTALR